MKPFVEGASTAMSANFRRAAVVFLVVGTVTALALWQPSDTTGQQINPSKGKPGLPIAADDTTAEFECPDINLPLDRRLRAKLTAAEDYMADGDWANACELLQKLLEAKQDSFAMIKRTDKQPAQARPEARASTQNGARTQPAVPAKKAAGDSRSVDLGWEPAARSAKTAPSPAGSYAGFDVRPDTEDI